MFHRFLFSGPTVKDSEVIMKGNGIILHYGLGGGSVIPGMEQKSKFTLEVSTKLSMIVLLDRYQVTNTRKKVGLF